MGVRKDRARHKSFARTQITRFKGTQIRIHRTRVGRPAPCFASVETLHPPLPPPESSACDVHISQDSAGGAGGIGKNAKISEYALFSQSTTEGVGRLCVRFTRVDIEVAQGSLV